MTSEPQMECPECGEDAVRRQPADLVPWEAHGIATPEWAHLDGTSLCPIIGPSGYEPARPQPRSGGRAADSTAPEPPEPVAHLKPEDGENVAGDVDPDEDPWLRPDFVPDTSECIPPELVDAIADYVRAENATKAADGLTPRGLAAVRDYVRAEEAKNLAALYEPDIGAGTELEAEA